MEDLEQSSMDDLSFGAAMPRGYKKRGSEGTPGVDKLVWHTSFFDQVCCEFRGLALPSTP